MTPSLDPWLTEFREFLIYAFVVIVQSLSHVQLFVTPWTAARQASLSFTISRSLLKFMFIKSVMPSNRLILCHPFLLLPSIFPSIGIFSNELALRIRWPKYQSSLERRFLTVTAEGNGTPLQYSCLENPMSRGAW